MPEGDTIHSAARRVGAALVGREIVSVETPQPRHRLDRWPDRLAGRAVRAVDARGKHLLLRFDGGLTIHSHLRMGGAWGVYRRGERWRRSPRRAWLVLRTPEHEVAQFDEPAYLRRLREDDPTRGIGDALLDQRNLAGIGNAWKAEACYLARIDPWRPVAQVSDDEALAIVRGVRPLMQRSVERGGRIATVFAARGGPAGPGRPTWVFERAGLPCRTCGATIRERGQGDDNRTTYWCLQCQR